jgi:hypothetical protein
LSLSAHGTPLHIELGREHYRRSEPSWEDAGRPSAAVELRWSNATLEIDLHVPLSDRTFAAADSVNRYDNEASDINGDSVQLYLRSGDLLSGWMLIPERESPWSAFANSTAGAHRDASTRVGRPQPPATICTSRCQVPLRTHSTSS